MVEKVEKVEKVKSGEISGQKWRNLCPGYTYNGSEQSIFYATNHIRIFDHATTAKSNRNSMIKKHSRIYF